MVKCTQEAAKVGQRTRNDPWHALQTLHACASEIFLYIWVLLLLLLLLFFQPFPPFMKLFLNENGGRQ